MVHYELKIIDMKRDKHVCSSSFVSVGAPTGIYIALILVIHYLLLLTHAKHVVLSILTSSLVFRTISRSIMMGAFPSTFVSYRTLQGEINGAELKLKGCCFLHHSNINQEHLSLINKK
jgi:hypothetical protein